MENTNTTLSPTELLEKLGVMAAEIFAIGIEEEADEVKAFKDAIGIVGRAKELPEEAISKVGAEMDSLIVAIRSSEPGKEDEVLDGKRIRGQENNAGKHIIEALTEACEWINEPDEWKRVDGLINYLEDFWDLKSAV